MPYLKGWLVASVLAIPAFGFGGMYAVDGYHQYVAAVGTKAREAEVDQSKRTAADALRQCDQLAAHPHDPGRYGAGVPDDQIAPGAAIEACEVAVQLNPNNPTAMFELGRAYWARHRDADAFREFVEAATQNYAPAMKYVGDAYLEGRGLPAVEKPGGYTALQWYQKSAQGGFPDGKMAEDEITARMAEKAPRAVETQRNQDEAPEAVQSSRFNSSDFQNPNYISAIYNNDFTHIEHRVFFGMYLQAFAHELGGDKLLYVKSECAPMMNELTSAAIGLTAVASGLDAFVNHRGVGALGEVVAGAAAKDQGKRDATALMVRYGCQSAVTLRIIHNMTLQYKDLQNPKSALDFLNRFRGSHPSLEAYSGTVDKYFPNARQSLSKLAKDHPEIGQIFHKMMNGTAAPAQ